MRAAMPSASSHVHLLNNSQRLPALPVVLPLPPEFVVIWTSLEAGRLALAGIVCLGFSASDSGEHWSHSGGEAADYKDWCHG
eukprot:3491109-Amphidinium_carterae.1